MSNKELALQLINDFSETQLAGIVSILQSVKMIAEETADDAFCEKLYQDYLNDPDPHKDDVTPIEELKKEYGLS